ncbi:MAG TPA: PH domain-containing protein [Methanolinea sp.]|nr:PH domain-containing protein [Methanolinea sp.]
MSRRCSTVLYTHITDLHLAQSFLGRLTRIGTISINTAGKDGFEMVMENIPHAEMVRSIIESRMIDQQGGRE